MALCPEVTQHSQSPWVSLDGEKNHADAVARDWVELCKVAPKRQYVPVALFYEIKTEVKTDKKFSNTSGSGGVYKNNGVQAYHGGATGSGPRNGGYKGHSKKFSHHNKQNIS